MKSRLQALADRFSLPLSLFLVALAVRVIIAPFTGHPYDLKIWLDTGSYVAQGRSPYELYDHIGYPPLWALWAGVSYLASSFVWKGNPFLYILIIKLPIIAADFGLALVLTDLYQTGRRRLALAGDQKPQKKSGLGSNLAAIFLLSPFTIVVGAVWGMMDNLAALLIATAAVAFFARRDVRAGVLYGLSVSLKLYPIILFPAFGVYLLKEKEGRLKRLVSFFGSSAVALGVTALLPFPLFGWNFVGLGGTLVAQLARVPGGISPLGLLSSLFDLGIKSVGSFSLTEFANLTVVREAWIGVWALAVLWLLIRRQAPDLPAFLNHLSLILVCWYLSSPWTSEQNIVTFLVLLLAGSAWKGFLGERTVKTYWMISAVCLLFVVFNVPATAFVWPVIPLQIVSPLYKPIRAIALIALSVAFTSILIYENASTLRDFWAEVTRPLYPAEYKKSISDGGEPTP
jgi:hypothetical protein